MYDLIIIGGGPAGITAGIYAARKKLNTLLIAKDFFGQTAKTGEIDNWPGSPNISGGALMQNFEKHLKNFAIDIKEGDEVSVILTTPSVILRHQPKDLRDSSAIRPQNDTIKDCHSEAAGEESRPQNDTIKDCHSEAAGEESRPQNDNGSKIFQVETKKGEFFEAKALVVCSGASPRKLGVAGEDKFIGKGVSFCSLCDAPFFQGKTVAVAGGGNSALEAALDLSKYANKIYLLEAGDFLRGDPLLQDLLKQTGKVEIRLNQEIKEIQGKIMVDGVAVFDRSSQKIEILAVSGVFVEIGWAPQSDFLNGLVLKNELGEIIIDQETGQTSLEGVFAAGDCANAKYKQVILASATGARAALSAYEYLQIPLSP